MKIETRYDVGDKVWPLLQVLTGGLHWQPCNEARTVTGITIAVHSSDNFHIEYMLTRRSLEARWGLATYPKYECHIFPTKELAQAECDRRNAEAKEHADG